MEPLVANNPDALPQLIGDFKPVDLWQAHIGELFYALRGHRVRQYFQTFAAADFRLAHALATDYYERAVRREKARGKGSGGQGAAPPSLVVHEWGCGNGNLAACFLTHLKALDREGSIYPRIRYVLVDRQQSMLDEALAHPDLLLHRDQVETLQADVGNLAGVANGSVDLILCNELWNELPTKLMLRKGGEIEEEHLRPNVSETVHAGIADWPQFVRAFENKQTDVLAAYPDFLADIIWEKEYHPAEWKDVAFRKTITEHLKGLDEHVLVPVNVGAHATLKEAKRVLAADAAGFSSFDAGTADRHVLNDPEKPCYGLFGGQYSFMVNFALVQAVGRYLGIASIQVEPQREFVGRSLGVNVMGLMDLLATFPGAGRLAAWEQDRLILQTIQALNQTYRSPYKRRIEFPLQAGASVQERQALEAIRAGLQEGGIPDTIAYLSEDEIVAARANLDQLGYEMDTVMQAFGVQPQPVDYYRLSWAAG